MNLSDQIKNISLNLLDSLQGLDNELNGYGLYAAEEYNVVDRSHLRGKQEWELALRPTLHDLGCRITFEANRVAANAPI